MIGKKTDEKLIEYFLSQSSSRTLGKLKPEEKFSLLEIDSRDLIELLFFCRNE